ncbi:DUF4185 domain-containing protein [Ruania halotolerans]|uniref:DUF4185 domain-containing protein n=1 Tax=Ruania halotolerans TaxID=2897773 RepID=UPI001E5DAD13|nr:DUF4185 domain-containing protein [Ruania halotolerans]UFU04976.1 DUF4185 domain-containing protein [Ruania halotolerans]
MRLRNGVSGGLALVATLALLACSNPGTGGGAPPAGGGDPGGEFLVTEVANVTQIAQLTGPDSTINDTESVAIAGTDLGSMFTAGERTYFVFGDTFGTRAPDAFGGGGGNWRSNAVAWTTDDDPTDGITFDDWVRDDVGLALEVAPGEHDPNNGEGEVTKIPTHGFAVEDTLYLQYMSVSFWGEAGQWDANHAGLVRSTDDGATWEVLDAPQWPGDSHFVQVSAALVEEDGEEFVYFWSIPSGRFGSVQLMKVPATTSAVEDLNAYRYFAGTDDSGEPIWSEVMDEAQTLIEAPVGELSVMYHPQLDRWLMTYLENEDAVLAEGLTPWGPWGESVTLTTQEETPGLYGPYTNPRYVSEDGQTIYFSLSLWGPYNVFWYSADLVTR